MLPNGSGLEILKALKEEGKRENVIIISAKDSLEDKLNGLHLGADDYLAKPFHLAELNARIRAVIRRNAPQGSEEIKLGNTSLNINQRQFLVNELPVPLNRKEFDILSYFYQNINRLISKTALAEHVWGDN